MEHLVLGLVLLARILAAGNPLHWRDREPVKEVALDVAPTSFDDQYRGCGRMMEEELEELNRTEFANNRIYAEAWTQAAAEWRSRRGRDPQPPALQPEQMVAVMAYTLQGPLHQAFNAAVREAGRSREEYLSTFHFKKNRTLPFGQDTFFSVDTCYGVPIRNFSFFPEEEEVLVPPFESFEVTNVTHSGDRALIQLRSRAAFSTYNCEWVKEKRCQNQTCDFSAGRSVAGDPRLLWGLLLAATALAAAGSP
ncbi:GPI-linked NAD(P)(+)--arginine ADP-ribosyltransferase 1 isoform X2 [Larus michahellis]|uniref:GPI-linked NAD(P)(+)--arginine ADP-ribosyltransferase 1 isoform X2 n=1 Tax=Larus michahellis TaxID=119627 RepID=UPI003D9AD0DF